MSSEDGLRTARERIAREAEAQTGFLDLGNLGLIALPDELFTLAHLQILNLGTEYTDVHGRRVHSAFVVGPNAISAQLGLLAALPVLRSLFLSQTDISDLAAVVALHNLQSLSFAATHVKDLAPIAALQKLQSLNCSTSPVQSLAPLVTLRNLQSLNCSATRVGDFAPLEALTNLQMLHCPRTQVRDLAPLAALQNLQSLNCSYTDVGNLAPLAALQKLQSLDCSETLVSTLAPLAALQNLQSLNCRETSVNDLVPLAALKGLQRLNCSKTQVSDLAPLAELQNLQSLDCSQSAVKELPEAVLFGPSLDHLVLFETRLSGVPPEMLSGSRLDNCLERLRAHVRDLAHGAAEMPDVKLMVLGNGRVGKTQLCRRLRVEPFDDAVESTHGIMVTSAPMRAPDGGTPVQLQIWDFGGQDIYHGTHALFTRSRAIFVLVWIPEAEEAHEHRHGGFVFRNQPLSYWLEYVRHFGGVGSPITIVQTRCEKFTDERIAPVPQDLLNSFRPLPKNVHYSALNERGRPSLDDALAQCVESLREREGGVALIGAGRAQVKRALEAMRDADARRPPLARQHRTISHDDYLKLCADAGGISNPGLLLDYLHNAGTVFHRAGLFENRIILDQGWALESIYAVFHRDKSYRRILRQNGRFTPSDLAEWIWDEAGHGAREQELLLSMMQSCGICFQYRAASGDGKIEAEYIAPDLLPGKPESEIAQKWSAELKPERAEFEYALLTRTLITAIVARIGSEAGLAADYWRDGVYVYETKTGSRGLIEQQLDGLRQGRIILQTQDGQAPKLLARLIALVEEEQDRLGLTPSRKGVPAVRLLDEDETASTAEKHETAAALQFAQEPSQQPELFVSYAWGDGTPEGKRREEVVDRLCAAAEERGLEILRDKNVLGLGDSIAKFMARLSQGHRIFVVLSDKYLKSPYCMYELLEIWRHCFQDEGKFLDRIRILVLPDAKVFSIIGRLQYATFWHEKRMEIESASKVYDITRLGMRDFKELKMMQKFSNEVGDILSAVADKIQARTFEEFEANALEDLIGPVP